MKTTISKSHGTKRIYAVKGYRDRGILFGFNTRFGGYSLWVRGGTDD